VSGDWSELSKAVSHALRHEPWLYEPELDDEGWTPVDALVEALSQEPRWRPGGCRLLLWAAPLARVSRPRLPRASRFRAGVTPPA